MLLTALAFGFLGSLHCAFMCGPLALAGCTRDGRLRARSSAGYLGGRLLAYTFLGAVFGSLGAHAQHLLPVAAVQRVLLLLVVGFALYKGIALLLPRRAPSELVPLRARSAPFFAARLLPRRGLPLGLATGLLPCGLLAGAWALAALAGDPMRGALTMLVFSLATLPSLAAGALLSTRLRWRPSPALAGLLWCALAIWIGVRPLFMDALHAHGGH